MADKTVTIKIGGDAAQLLNVLNQIQEQIKNTGEGAEAAGAKLKKISGAVPSGAIASLSAIGQDLESAGQKISDYSAGIVKGIAAMAAGAAGAVGGLVYAAANAGGGFESQMIRVQSLSNATGEQLEKLTLKAREMGRTLPIAAREAARTMTVLAQLGTKAGELDKFAEAAANLAITQQTKADEAAAVIKETMTQFDIDVGRLSNVVDSLNNASNASKLDLRSIGEAMKFAAPNAKTLKMSLEETLAALVALSNAGMEGGLGGRGLSAVMGTLAGIKSNESALGILKRLKVDVQDASGALRDWRDIMSDIKNSDYAAGDIYGIFGTGNADVANILLENIDKLEEYRQELERTGTTARMLEQEMKSFQNVWKSLGSAAESVHITFFDQIKNQSVGVIQEITKMIRVTDEWAGKTNAGGKAFDAFLRGLGVSFSQSGFKEWLDGLDVDAAAERVEGLGAALRSVGETAAAAIDMLRPVFSFLIDHVEAIVRTAAAMWVVGKIEQYYGALKQLAAAFRSVEGGAAAAGAKLTVMNTWIGLIAGASMFLIEQTNKLREAQKEAYDARNIEKVGIAVHNEIKKLDAALSGDAEAAQKLSGIYKEAFDEIRQGGGKAAGAWIKFARDNGVLQEQMERGLISYEEYSGAVENLRKNFNAMLAAIGEAPALPADSLKLRKEIMDTWLAGAMSVKEYGGLIEELDSGGGIESIAQKYRKLKADFGETNVKDISSVWEKALAKVAELTPEFTKKLNEGMTKGLTRQEAFGVLKNEFDENMQAMLRTLKEVHSPAVAAAFKKMTDESMEALRGLTLDEMTDGFKRMNEAAGAGFLGKKFGLQNVAKNWNAIKSEIAETVKNLKGIPKDALKGIMNNELLAYLDSVGDKIAALNGRTPETLNGVIRNVNTAIDAMSGYRDTDRRNKAALGAALPDLNAILRQYEEEFPHFRENFLGLLGNMGGALGKDMAAALNGSMEESGGNIFANMLGAGGDGSIEAIKEFKRYLDQAVAAYREAQKKTETLTAPDWKLIKPEDINPSESAGALRTAGQNIGRGLSDGIKLSAGKEEMENVVRAVLQSVNEGAKSFVQAGRQAGASVLSGMEEALNTGIAAKLAEFLDIDATATGAKVGKSFSNGFLSGLDFSGLESRLYESVSNRFKNDIAAAGGAG
jgi:TP901 family phage tail tape measure protein